LEFEEDNRIDGGTASSGIAGPDESADEGEVEGTFEVAIEVVSGDEIRKGEGGKCGEDARFAAHHGRQLLGENGWSRCYVAADRISTPCITVIFVTEMAPHLTRSATLWYASCAPTLSEAVE
jgi:hypothetical protein